MENKEVIDSKDLGSLGAYIELDVAHKKIEELKHQLAEKDKEIDDWKDGTMILRIEKETRNQVCEKIRKMLKDCSEWYEQGYFIDMPLYDIIEKVDQIEQGESDGTRNSKNV